MKKLICTLICFFTLACACIAETVVFNVKTLKIHKVGCRAAISCTKNCIKIERKEAIKRGGVPCKLCGQ